MNFGRGVLENRKIRKGFGVTWVVGLVNARLQKREGKQSEGPRVLEQEIDDEEEKSQENFDGQRLLHCRQARAVPENVRRRKS